MSIRTIVYENRNPGHDKQYTLEVDAAALTMVSTWGPIGGHMTTRTETFSSKAYIWAALSNAMRKRLARGYTCILDDTASATPSAGGMATGGMIVPPTSAPITRAKTALHEVDKWTLERDVWEMQRAERLAKK